MKQEVECRVLEILPNHIVLQNPSSIWWLGSSPSFKIPKDEKMKNISIGSIVKITLSESE